MDASKTSLAGRVALVTGGGSGIGRATALLFGHERAKVVVVDVAPAGGEETVRAIRADGGEGLFVQADVSQPGQVTAMVQRAVEAYGRLDCAFNNAGVSSRSPLHETSEDDWDRVLGVDLKGVWLCLREEIAQMLRQQGGGAIVNTSSIAGVVGVDWGMAPYIASKHGVIGLTKAAALEYGTRGIRVNAVCPGTIDTPLLRGNAQSYVHYHPLGRIGQPDEVAQAVVWLCSGAASFVTGHAMAVDGGWLAGVAGN
jgi:NAD(P)-dependent dehydrogenase (short-subunit alcohol dehydrogenase family)